MEKFNFTIYSTKEITDFVTEIALKLLSKQGKVHAPNKARIRACKEIILCWKNKTPVAIGAIKKKTVDDFSSTKANLVNLGQEFDWELGYFYTDEELRGLGVAAFITKLLLKRASNINLMASTELFPKNGMIKILLSNGFIQVGNPWKSTIHDGILGLFIKVKEGEERKQKLSILPR